MTMSADGMKYADLDSRFGAFVVDWHVRTIPIALWGFLVFFETIPVYFHAGQFGFGIFFDMAAPFAARHALSFWLSTATYFLYHPVIELLMQGNSIGKRMMKIKVVDASGRPPSAKQVLVRNLWRAIEFLPVFWLWAYIAIRDSKENARTGDIKAGTRVVVDQR
ncbi:MAG: RDD family protein [Gammaproteobacteria bacterium]|nr:RDD family protein [Gammaproteobacteria bacterium]